MPTETSAPETRMLHEETREDRLVSAVEALIKGIREIAEENKQMRAAVQMYAGRNARVEASNIRLEDQRNEANARILELEQTIRDIEE